MKSQELKFNGTLAELKDILRNHDILGEIHERPDCVRFKTEDGAFLNWYSNGTIGFQEIQISKLELEEKLADEVLPGGCVGIWDRSSQSGKLARPTYLYFSIDEYALLCRLKNRTRKTSADVLREAMADLDLKLGPLQGEAVTIDRQDSLSRRICPSVILEVYRKTPLDPITSHVRHELIGWAKAGILVANGHLARYMKYAVHGNNHWLMLGSALTDIAMYEYVNGRPLLPVIGINACNGNPKKAVLVFLQKLFGKDCNVTLFVEAEKVSVHNYWRRNQHIGQVIQKYKSWGDEVNTVNQIHGGIEIIYSKERKITALDDGTILIPGLSPREVDFLISQGDHGKWGSWTKAKFGIREGARLMSGVSNDEPHSLGDNDLVSQV